MSQHQYIDHVLANYFAVGIGQSEEEAIDALRRHIATSPELAAGLRSDMQQALDDPSYSWCAVLSEYDVLTLDDEAAARDYAKRMLWDRALAGRT